MRTTAWLLLAQAGLAVAEARAGLSQARMEDDCLQRLRPIIPREVKVHATRFGALGIQANYYVVTHSFKQALAHGRTEGVCTYRRDGQWVSDDAASHKLAGELEASRKR